MLVNMIDMLAKAAAEGYGVGNFDVFNTELLKGVMEAAEEANAPVILAYGPPFEKYSPLKYFAPAVKAWAADTDLPVVLHYDHGTSLEGCVHAVECGCNSIMIDASSKPFEENVKTVREVVDFCHPRGIPVEAELGHVGDEGEYSLENYGYTDPVQAKEFVLRTGVDFLAVAIGNQHGVYTAEPKINYEVLQAVREAVEQTWGRVLTYDGKICDARFSKCCGGVFEEFKFCWEPKQFPYLVKRRDAANENDFPDLTVEENARKWILSEPDAFCNTKDPKILSQVLTKFDQETKNFYRWTVEYTVDELSDLVRRRSGEDFGEILDLIPVARGTSGRLWKLKIVGTKKTKIIGKELEIRKTLSPSHLYSSAFVVEKQDGKFILRGAGWGHGVGMCQIGAAVMGAQGYKYDEILAHYFPGSTIEKKY